MYCELKWKFPLPHLLVIFRLKFHVHFISFLPFGIFSWIVTDIFSVPVFLIICPFLFSAKIPCWVHNHFTLWNIAWNFTDVLTVPIWFVALTNDNYFILTLWVIDPSFSESICFVSNSWTFMTFVYATSDTIIIPPRYVIYKNDSTFIPTFLVICFFKPNYGVQLTQQSSCPWYWCTQGGATLAANIGIVGWYYSGSVQYGIPLPFWNFTENSWICSSLQDM